MLHLEKMDKPVKAIKGVFSSRNENFCMSHRMFRGCRKGFSDTNKKTNYIARLETARQIY